MSGRRKPTRRDLLVVIGQLQDAIGRLSNIAQNDRNKNKMDDFLRIANPAHELCIAARSYDPPIDVRLGPWAPLDPQGGGK